MKVLGFDPGKHNFAYAVVRNERCVDYGTVRTVDDLGALSCPDQIARFRRDVDKIFRNHRFKGTDPFGDGDVVAFERMQHRPNLGGGAVVEYINLMLGMIVSIAHDKRLRLMPFSAATWKSHYAKMFNYQRGRFTMSTQKLSIRLPAGSKQKTKTELVTGVLDGQDRAPALNPHEADAVGIACYAWYRATGGEIIRTVMNDEKAVLIDQSCFPATDLDPTVISFGTDEGGRQ